MPVRTSNTSQYPVLSEATPKSGKYKFFYSLFTIKLRIIRGVEHKLATQIQNLNHPTVLYIALLLLLKHQLTRKYQIKQYGLSGGKGIKLQSQKLGAKQYLDKVGYASGQKWSKSYLILFIHANWIYQQPEIEQELFNTFYTQISWPAYPAELVPTDIKRTLLTILSRLQIIICILKWLV